MIIVNMQLNVFATVWYVVNDRSIGQNMKLLNVVRYILDIKGK